MPVRPGIDRIEWNLVEGNEQRSLDNRRFVAYSPERFEREDRRFRASIAAKEYSSQKPVKTGTLTNTSGGKPSFSRTTNGRGGSSGGSSRVYSDVRSKGVTKE